MAERFSRTRLYLVSMAAAVALTLALALVLMRPPSGDLTKLALLFALSASVSAAIGYFSHRLGWWRRLKSLSFSLTVGYVLAAGLTLLNVWITAQLMFISSHDLVLAGVLLFFAAVISVSFGALMANSITASLRRMASGASRLSEGDFSVRVPVSGRDEVAGLALAFNSMAAKLERADEEASRLERARRDFVAWASHDLRTPLTALQAMVDALSDGVVEDAETVDRYLRQCRNEIDRMNDLIDGLFELAQLDAAGLELTCETSSLSDLISDTIGGVSARAVAKGVSVTGSVDPAVDPVWLAPKAIGRVLHNLLDNALRHTQEGGQIHLHAKREDGSVEVAVRDSGEGIPPEDLSRIFERFYRGEKSRTRNDFTRGGAGLGLAIAKGLVEAHGGQIWAENPPGGGAVLIFRLPSGGPEVQARGDV